MLTRAAFWYLRHGETDWNARGLSQGNVDVPLNALGLAQAREAAASLRGQGIRSVVASPLSRARDTAEIVADALGLPVETEPERTPPVLGVAHGALFRALRAEMGLLPNVRTPNATPLLCTPGDMPGAAWSLAALGEYEGAVAVQGS